MEEILQLFLVLVEDVIGIILLQPAQHGNNKPDDTITNNVNNGTALLLLLSRLSLIDICNLKLFNIIDIPTTELCTVYYYLAYIQSGGPRI